LGLLDWALASSVADMSKTGCVHGKRKADSALRSAAIKTASVRRALMIEIHSRN
jgi:hypothetical protein